MRDRPDSFPESLSGGPHYSEGDLVLSVLSVGRGGSVVRACD